VAKELTKVVRVGVERACVAFTDQLETRGFQRTRKMFWVRVNAHTAEVLHLHRSGVSYGAPLNASVGFRLHLALRVLTDSFPAVALNGPSTDTAGRDERYHLRFNAESMDMFDRCVRDLVRFVELIGEPWFARFQDPHLLLTRKDSPLNDEQKAHLREALAGNALEMNTAETDAALGLRSRRR
jgi:hypothetical protein